MVLRDRVMFRMWVATVGDTCLAISLLQLGRKEVGAAWGIFLEGQDPDTER